MATCRPRAPIFRCCREAQCACIVLCEPGENFISVACIGGLTGFQDGAAEAQFRPQTWLILFAARCG